MRASKSFFYIVLSVVLLALLSSCMLFLPPLNKPQVVNPKNEAVDVNFNNLTLEWKVDANGLNLKYDLYLSETESDVSEKKDSALKEKDITEAKYEISSLKASTQYYWRVVVKDDHNRVVNGDVWKFKTKANTSPSVPELTEPNNGSENLDTTVTLKWNSSTDPDGDTVKYDVYISASYDDVNGLQQSALKKQDLTETQYKVEDLSENTTYYWRVVAKDGRGGGSKSDVWSFKTKASEEDQRVVNHPPETPSSPKPKSGAVNVPLNITLSWESRDIDGDSIVYDVYLSDVLEKIETLSSDVKIASGISEQATSIGQLTENKTYYWRIVATDDKGNKSTGPIWKFITLKIEDESEYPNSVFISGDYLYVTTGPVGMKIYKILDENSITEISKVNTPGYSNDLYINGNYAYIADGNSGLTIIDVSNSEEPSIVRTLDLRGYAKGIFVSGNYAYIAACDKGLVIVDVSNPTSPSTVSIIETGGKANDVFVVGGVAYVANGDNGLVTIDVSSPSAPSVLGSVNFYGYAKRVYVSGSYAYVAAGNNGLVIVDISQPENMSVVHTFSKGGQIDDVYIKSTTAYLADFSNGIVVVDVSTANSSFELNSFSDYRYANSVYVSNNIVAISCGTNGVKVMGLNKASNRAPASPFSPNPSDNASEVSVSLNTVEWEAYDPDGDTMYFDMYFSTNRELVENLDREALHQSSISSTSTTIPTLNGHTTYYWRIVARDSYSRSTAGPIWKFTTENRSPTKPTLLFPEDDMENINTSVTFRWNSYDPDGDNLLYNLMVSTDKDFGTNNRVFNGIDGTEKTVSDLQGHTTYYWKVIARDEYGGETESDVSSFTTANNSPDDFVALNPEDGSLNVPRQGITLQWSVSDPDNDELTYDLYFSDSAADLDNSTKTENLHSNTYTITDTLDSHKVYYWKVRAKDQYGGVTTGPIWKFETENTPPDFAGSFSPDDGSNGLPTSGVELRWNASDSDGDEVYFDLYFSDDQTEVQSNDINAKLLTKSTQTSYEITDLKGHTKYYWKVVVYDAYNGEKESEVMAFTTENSPPPTPTYIYPNDGDTVDAHVSLMWSTGADPDGDELTYYIYITDDQTQIDSVTPHVSSETNFTPSDLLGHTTYYWKVVVSDGFGGEKEGAVWSFTTENRSPNTPSNPDPESGETSVEINKVLSWSGGDPDGDEVKYWVYLSTDKSLVDSKDSAALISDSAGISETSLDASAYLSGHTTYFWKVVAKDSLGGESESPTWVFTTQNRLPNISLNSPEDLATGVELSTTLVWSASDEDGDTLSYDVYLSSDMVKVQSNDNSAFVERTNSQSVSVNNLQPHTTYYWKVIAYDEWGSAQSEIRQFETINRAPTIEYLSPDNESTGVETDVTLRWSGNDVDGDTLRYTVYLSTDENAVENMNDSAVVASGIEEELYSATLEASTVYYWRVVADDGYGGTSVGPVWSFTTRKEVEFRVHGNYDTSGNSRGVMTVGNNSYIADMSNGLVIVDVSDKDNIQLSSQKDTSANAYKLWIDGNYAYIASGSAGMDIFDISNPDAPSSVATYPTSSTANDVMVDGDYAYIADDASGLVIVDVASLSAPSGEGQIDTSGDALSVYVSYDYAYLGNDNGYLDIIDISDPSNMTVEASVQISSSEIYDVFVDGDYAYVVDTSHNFTIVDVSSKSSPSIKSQTDVGTSAYSVFVYNNYAYVGTSDGIVVFNVRDKSNPYVVNSIDTDGSVMDIYIENNYIYIAEGYEGLLIVEIY